MKQDTADQVSKLQAEISNVKNDGDREVYRLKLNADSAERTANEVTGLLELL
ncbi:hypothetical protein HYT01_02210 [Candidatus Giovannonibacteria bacterium]|nr:hypothetical protein [Candidatus Giovannonibacteria bacterium]